jgi:UDPglucose--hexose-1-phosphate uridylyltransferase
MEFPKETVTAEFLNPQRGFKRETRSMEYRRDPLTGFRSRINIDRATRVKQAQRMAVDVSGTDYRSADGCIFCGDNIEKATTKFVPEILPGNADGRIRVGQCVLFPNLHPFAEHHAVGTLTECHHLELDEFTPVMIADNLEATQEYITAVRRIEAGAVYPVWIWNHLPPSGASIIHPHVQIALERAPMPEIDNLFTKSATYMRENGVNFWRELITVEKNAGARFIGENDSVAVIAAFAPRGNRDIQIISKRVGCIADFDERHMYDFADAVVRALRGYKDMGVNSFNLLTYSAAVGDHPDHFLFSARMISRPVFQPLYSNDSGSIERFYGVSVIEAMPEIVAAEMRKRFEG